MFVFIAPPSANNWEDVQAKARHLLLHTYGLSRCTVQVQTHRQRLVRSCANCQQPSAWRERLFTPTLTSTVHLIEPNGRRPSSQMAWMSHRCRSSVPQKEQQYTVMSGKRLVPKESQWNNSRCKFLIEGSLQPLGTLCSSPQFGLWMLKSQSRRMKNILLLIHH